MANISVQHGYVFSYLHASCCHTKEERERERENMDEGVE